MSVLSRKAIILDRDGVILEERDHLWKIEEAEFIPDTIEALRLLSQQYLLFIASNQAGIGKGLYTEADYHQLTTWMLRRLEISGVIITGIYYCPHHPEAAVLRYKADCDCRKPKPGLLKRIQADHTIDLQHSWMIGDKTSDIAAGASLRMRTALVRTGYAGQDSQENIQATVVADDLRSAVNQITRFKKS